MNKMETGLNEDFSDVLEHKCAQSFNISNETAKTQYQ